MGFRAEKERIDKKKGILKKVLLCIIVAIVLGGSMFSFFVPPESWRYYFAYPDVSKREKDELRIHFLDVGQGDCTLIELPDGKVALVDGGDEKSSTEKTIMRYLNALDIDKIDYLIVTHTDKDHCGSLKTVFRYKKVLGAYLPHTFEESDVQYAEAYAAALDEGCEMIKGSSDVVLSSADASYVFRFLYPHNVEALGEYSKESAVLWLEYKGVRTLLCGDVDKQVEDELLRDASLGILPTETNALVNTQILKVAHHGSGNGTSTDFLKHIKAEYAVVSCGKDNVYGHPARETLERLDAAGVKTYRTDLSGTIVARVKADGSYTVNAS